MARSTLNYHQVELLYQVIRCRTLTAAAESLFISQPAVTKQLKILESNLGVRLFNRERGRLVPTAEAILLYEQTERTNASLRALNELADGLRAGALGRLAICAIPAVTEHLLPISIAEFQCQYPKVTIEVAVENAEKMLDLVESQQVDFGICPIYRETKNVLVSHLLDSQIVCAMDRDDPLATRSEVDIRDLHGKPLTTVSALEAIPELWEAINVSGVRQLIDTRVANSALACKLVTLSDRRAIIDGFTAASLEETKLVFVPLAGFPTRNLSILRPILRPPSTLSNEFLQVLEEKAKLFGLRRDAD